jgi:hypothetical protein
MAKAIVKRVSLGNKNSQQIYCMSKSGNIYKLKQQVPLQQHARLISQIKAAGVINTTHWVKVREGEKPRPRISKDRSFWVRDTEGRPTQIHVGGGRLLIAGGAA